MIGNEDYNSYKLGTSYEVNVDYAVADAKAFAEYAKCYMGVPESNIKIQPNATFAQTRREINKLISMSHSDPGNLELFVFYAGHGQHDTETKETYLIPVDVRKEVGKNSKWIKESEQTPELIDGLGIESGWENWMLD